MAVYKYHILQLSSNGMTNIIDDILCFYQQIYFPLYTTDIKYVSFVSPSNIYHTCESYYVFIFDEKYEGIGNFK